MSNNIYIHEMDSELGIPVVTKIVFTDEQVKEYGKLQKDLQFAGYMSSNVVVREHRFDSDSVFSNHDTVAFNWKEKSVDSEELHFEKPVFTISAI